MAKKATRWLPLFRKYLSNLRIQSKHATDDIDGTGIELRLWTSQTMVLEQICDGLENDIHTFYILKSRQLGVTTITLAILLFWLALNPNTIGCLVSDNEKNKAKNRETIARYHASLSKFMGKGFGITKSNKFGFVFSNGSRLDLLVAGTKANWGEGEGYLVGHLCVAPDTPVILADGRVKEIRFVRKGDLLFTHTGEPTKVIDVCGQPNSEPMIRVTPWLGQAITFSPGHTIPTQRGLVEAKDLGRDDWLIMPLREISDLVKTVTLPEAEKVANSRTKKEKHSGWVRVASAGAGSVINLTEDFGFAIGYYLAEGTIIWQPGSGKRKRPSGITFTRHRSEKHYADRAIEACRPFTTGAVRTVDRSNSLTSQDTIYGTALADFISKTFGATDEKIIPDDVFDWGRDFCRGLLSGILSGDGSKTECFAQGYPTNTMVMPSSRASLATQVRDIAAALGYGWASLRHLPPGNRYGRNCTDDWRLMWFGKAAADLRELIGLQSQPFSAKKPKYRIAGNTIWLPIRKIETDVQVDEKWDISVLHADHTFRTPWMSIGNTEVASYSKPEGIESFRHAMAPENPRALYIFEGTAHGPNHWKDMWEAARRDPYSSKCIFVGWWSHDLQRIRPNDRQGRWEAFGTQPPTSEENDSICAVRDLYGYEITMPQLAWRRWQQTLPNSNENDLDQNQPYTEIDCFIQAGTSFFIPKLLADRREEITSAPEALVEDGGYGYRAYSFYLGDEYHLSKVEPITTPVPPDMIKMRVWEKPHPEGIYSIGVDPAGGRSENSNCHAVSIWRCFADKMVQVCEWADNIPDTRHCAWVTAYLAGQYANCRVNIDLTGGIGMAVMQAFEDLRREVRSEMYQKKAGDFEDFLASASWYMYRRVDSPGPGYMYSTKLGRDLKWKTMNMLRDSWVSRQLEIRSVPLLDEMVNVVQTRADIGASAPGRQRDDRTFAMALANTTWVENLRPGLIAAGLTWEGATQKESGAVSPVADMLNRRVYALFRAVEEGEDAPKPQTFFEARGLSR